MLAIFETQLTTIDSELLTLQQRLSELESIKNDLQAKQAKASEVLESLKALAADLAGDAIQNLKSAVLGIFGNTASENGSKTELFTDFVTEIPKMPTEEEIFDAECLPPAEETTPEVVTPAVQPKPAPYMEFVQVQGNPTLGYFKKTSDGEIGSIYLGCSSHRLANEWGKMISLWGGDVQQIRLAKRLNSDGIKYEVKFIKCDFDRILKIAKAHPSPDAPVPSPHEPQKKQAPAPATTPPSNDLSATGENSDATGSDANKSEPNKPKSEWIFQNTPEYDPLMPEWNCYCDGIFLGKVTEVLTQVNGRTAYRHNLLKGAEWQKVHFYSREDAAANLLNRRDADAALHDKTNAQLRAAYGF